MLHTSIHILANTLTNKVLFQDQLVKNTSLRSTSSCDEDTETTQLHNVPHKNNTSTSRYDPTGKHQLPNCNLCWPDHTDMTGQAQSAIHPNAADKTSKQRQPGYTEIWRKTYRQCMRNKFRSTLFQTVYTLPLFYAFWFNAPCQWSLLNLRPIISLQRPSAGSALTLTPTHSIIS